MKIALDACLNKLVVIYWEDIRIFPNTELPKTPEVWQHLRCQNRVAGWLTYFDDDIVGLVGNEDRSADQAPKSNTDFYILPIGCIGKVVVFEEPGGGGE